MMPLGSVPLLLTVSICGSEFLAHEAVAVMTINIDSLDSCAKDGMNNCPDGVGEHVLLQAKGQISRPREYGQTYDYCRHHVGSKYMCKDKWKWSGKDQRDFGAKCYATNGYSCWEVRLGDPMGSTARVWCKETSPIGDDPSYFTCLPEACEKATSWGVGWDYGKGTRIQPLYVQEDKLSIPRTALKPYVTCYPLDDLLKPNPPIHEEKKKSCLKGNWVHKGKKTYNGCAQTCGDEDCMIFSRPAGKGSDDEESCWISTYGGYPGDDCGEDLWLVKNPAQLPATKLTDSKCFGDNIRKWQGQMTWLECLYKCEDEGCSFFAMWLGTFCLTTQVQIVPESEPCYQHVWKVCRGALSSSCAKVYEPEPGFTPYWLSG